MPIEHFLKQIKTVLQLIKLGSLEKAEVEVATARQLCASILDNEPLKDNCWILQVKIEKYVAGLGYYRFDEIADDFRELLWAQPEVIKDRVRNSRPTVN